MKIRLTSLALLLFSTLLPVVARAGEKPAIIEPGAAWLDDRGQPIEAHGGGMLYFDHTYYWYGEDRTSTLDANKRYVACYASHDLVHWQFRGDVFVADNLDGLGKQLVLERPKVFYNAHTKKFVLYMHIDKLEHGGYTYARVGVATSDKADGPYTYIRSFRPLGQESRDIGQFVDDDGSAYLIFESRPTHGFFIARLSDDYLDVAEQMSFIKSPIEGGAIVHHDGLYYVLGSHLTGWGANPNVYATAPSLRGPWSSMRNIAPPEVNTWQSQSTLLLKIVGSKQTSIIYMGDRWNPHALWDSRYIWMPVTMHNGEMQLPEPRPWSIDLASGELTMPPLKTFTNPIKATGPDPWIYNDNGTYYVMHTTGSDIELTKTNNLGDLAHAEHKILWRPEPNKPWSAQVWAPEITRWNGKWYIYFCADAGSNESHRIFVLENESADPMQGEWQFKGQVSDSTNRWAIDPDVFAFKGEHYLLWSGWEGDKDGEQRVYIAHLANPWTVDSPRTELTRPEFDWEMHDGRKQDFQLHVNEGPEALVHGNRVFITYSASACWSDDYQLGLLTSAENANLLDAKSWSKAKEPVFKQLPEHHAYGTGHNGFFTAPDGTSWIVYHANTNPGEGCGNKRTLRMQPFTWNADGSPNFGEPAQINTPIPLPR